MAQNPSDKSEMTAKPPPGERIDHEHDTLKYSLLGPSLTKPGQDNVDQQKAIPLTNGP
jgi:hypothetical protein